MSVLSELPKKFSRAAKKRSMKLAPAPRRAAAPVAALAPIALPGNLLSRLNALRRKHRMVGVVTGLSMLVGAAILLLLAQTLCDWWFDLPWFARAGFLLADLAVLGLLYRRQLDGPIRLRLNLARTALLVEKKWPQLQQSLIASVELTEGKSLSTRGSRQLIDVLLQQARARTTSLKFGDVVSTRGMRNWLLGALAIVLSAGAVAALTWPSCLALLERVFLLNVPLPTKTIVLSVTRDLVVPFGTDVQLTAEAQGIIPSHGRVTITYQEGAPQEFPVTLSPDQPATFILTVHNVQNGFKYSFTLNDGHGPDWSVTAKVPPTITNLDCEQDYPAYTGLPPQKLAATELSLLPGGRLKVTASSGDQLKSAQVILAGGKNAPVAATLDGTGKSLEADIPIPAKDVTGFSIHLVDQSGVSSTDETVYPITLVPDHPPEIKIIQPTEAKETITIRANPPIDFDASDDFGLAQIVVKYQKVTPAIAGQTATAPPGPVQSITVPIKPGHANQHYEYLFNVSAQSPPWKEGDTYNYWMEAVDNNTLTGPGVTKTDSKQFTVISLAAKQQEIMERLQKNAAEIQTISDTTTKISNDVKEAIPQK